MAAGATHDQIGNLDLTDILSSSGASERPTPDGEGLASKLAREASVVGGGIAGSLGEGISALKNNPGQLAADVAGTVGLVLALKGPAPIRAMAATTALLGQLSFARQAVSGIINTTAIAEDTWHSAKNADVDRALVKRELGPVLVDGAIMAIAGAGAAKGLEAPSMWRAWSKRDLIPRVTMESGLPAERLGYRHARNYYAASDSLVFVRADSPGRPSSDGSGFFVSADGLVVTAKHVLTKGLDRDAMTVHVFHKGVEFEAKVIKEDPLNDLSILQITKNHPDDFFPALKIASEDVRVDSKTLSIGRVPAVREPMASPGRVLRDIEVGKDQYFDPNPFEGFLAGSTKHLLNGRLRGGMSGGPVVNSRGEVVGVNTHSNRSPLGEYGLTPPLKPLAELVQASSIGPREIKVRNPHYYPGRLGNFIDLKDGVRERTLEASAMLNYAVVESYFTPEVAEAFCQRYSRAKGTSEIDRITEELLKLGVPRPALAMQQ